jgi:hypothetical protein
MMNTIALRKTVRVSLLCGFVVALLLWLAVEVNDEVLHTRSASYIAVLLQLQGPGISAASRWFPCAGEGDPPSGCEPYKTAPATILVNALIFAGVLLVPIYFLRKLSTTLD